MIKAIIIFHYFPLLIIATTDQYLVPTHEPCGLLRFVVVNYDPHEGNPWSLIPKYNP